MSLKIWLPMNRDLRNQGLLNNTITNSGATYSSDGKLGGCYIFDGVDDSLAVGNLSTMVETDFSFACWFYKDEWGSKGYETIFGGPSGFELESKVSSTNSPVLKLYNWGGGSCTYELSKWNHIVFTRNSTETKLYLNGELKVTGSAGTIPNNNYFVGSWNSATQQNFKGKMCDVRIYDNCLSPMEIKQLSQGLVLHYPLNRGGWGQENLLVDTYNWSTLTNASSVSEGYWYNNGGTAVRGYDNINNITYCKIWHSDNSSWTRYSRQYVTMQPNTYYTVSILCRINTDIAHLSIRNDRNEAITFFALNVELTNKNWEWKTFTAKTHTNTSQEPFVIYAQVNSDGVLSSDTSIDIAMVKLEEGSIATPWCPNSSDELATTMGLNSTIEYDCSGFCNNGTRIGTFDWTSDTPKYQVSTAFDGTNYISTTTPGADILTLSCWVKTSKNKSTSQIMVADSTSQLCISFYSGTIITFYASSGYSTGSKCTLGSAYKENDWNHLVVVKTGTGTRKVYCNGVEQTATSNDYWSSSSVGFTVARRETSTPHAFYGELCDVRAYATALSADDVKSLYQNCATIDPDGTIRGQIRS